MSWIQIHSYEGADRALQKLYDRVKGPDGHIDNIMLVHGLRPASLKGHMTLYKSVLHHRDNQLSRIDLELIGVYVSMLNRCDYCVEHHYAGLLRLMTAEKGAWFRTQMASDTLDQLEPREAAMLRYAKLLTRNPSDITEEDIQALRACGFDDGMILEINQVAAYFAYANRTVLGLGVQLEPTNLGLSPSDNSDPDAWGHH